MADELGELEETGLDGIDGIDGYEYGRQPPFRSAATRRNLIFGGGLLSQGRG